MKDEDLFPYLLVNIGSGVSICCIKNRNEWQRVGGTSMGGGTFWGLGRLLTGVSNFDELLALAGTGRREGVDTLVKDIYGNGFNNSEIKFFFKWQLFFGFRHLDYYLIKNLSFWKLN
jgi:type II pantothenate kinase